MIKYLVMDVDGTLTDGKIYMGPNGEAMKAFSVKDGYVINYILKPVDIKPIIITARNSSIVQHRCDELGIKDVYQGKLDKLSTLREIVGDNLEKCAYFGDDILDLKCMFPIKEAGGIVGCPSDAVQEVKAVSDYVCINKAGEGALREFAEWLVKPKEGAVEIEARVKKALTYIKELDVDAIPVDEKVIVDDNFFFVKQVYDTKLEAECQLESHRKYIDIQFVISGEECMDISDISRLTLKKEYDDEKDVIFWQETSKMARVTLRGGDYIILYPEHAHKGAMMNKKSSKILKVVGKVSVSI